MLTKFWFNENNIFYRWTREINEIGLKDWFWFVYYLERDEFNPKLQQYYYFKKYHKNSKDSFQKIIKKCQKHLLQDRSRAHRIDNVLSELRNLK